MMRAGACARSMASAELLARLVQGDLRWSPSLPSDFPRAVGHGVGPRASPIGGRIASRHAVTSCQSGSLPDPLNTVRHDVRWTARRSDRVGQTPCPPGAVGQAVRQPVHRVPGWHRAQLRVRSSVRRGAARRTGVQTFRPLECCSIPGQSDSVQREVRLTLECGLARLCRLDCLLDSLPVRLHGDTRSVRPGPRWRLARFAGQSLTRGLTLPDWPRVVLLVGRTVPRGRCARQGVDAGSGRLSLSDSLRFCI